MSGFFSSSTEKRNTVRSLITEFRKISCGKMLEQNFTDEMDCGSFFDHIDDLLDFPPEVIDEPLLTVGNGDSLPNSWYPECDTVFYNNSASHLSAELSVPYEDMVQLEWMSKFVENSFECGSLTMKKENVFSVANKEESGHRQFQTSSPVSVLESSSSCSEDKPAGCSQDVVAAGRCGRARSKRPRPAIFVPRPSIQLISPASSVGETPQQFISPKAFSNSENFAESKQVCAEHQNKKKKKLNCSVPPFPAETHPISPPQSVRKCLHCEITKTPQWRAGPMGPKTLCNACGVRYKSGRLFPQYRPAASPTFLPSLHSNSHKRVLEMRNKIKDNATLDTNELTNPSDFPELIPNTNISLPDS